MTEPPPAFAFLRQVSFRGKTESSAVYPLVAQQTLLIGRDPRCQVVLDSESYGGVSRQHAKICPASESASGWQVCDLTSANGTYVNGQRIHGCWNLRQGDRITLAQDGPQFLFEVQPSNTSASPAAPPNPSISAASLSPTRRPVERYYPTSPPDTVTFSQLFPIVSTGRDLTRKAYLVPGSITVAFVVLMFVSIGNPIVFNLFLAIYISGAAYYFVYRLCGKHKPWWLLLSTALMTIVLLISPVLDLFILVFRGILPGAIPENTALPANPFVLLLQMFFGAGLMEELIKAVPVFLVYFVGTKLRSPKRESIGVWEPLDGILLGTASAVGFTLLETLGQYVPGITDSVPLQAGEGAAQIIGIQLLIPRILGSISGHMAYSGYFGYFIGLSVLKPNQRWQILGVGYLTAAALHALWNVTGIINFLVLAVVGIVSYAFLAAAILKARALSPTRSQNFATRFSRMR
jgi:RsiW-degrading membrane proteinase PrsW (M82 family)